MSAIHQTVLDHIQHIMTVALISSVDPDDPTYCRVVKQGPLFDDPYDPDQARIFFEIYENDPEDFEQWQDRIVMVESSSVITMARRFTVKGRMLLEDTREPLLEARRIASIVKGRAETALLADDWTNIVADDGEYVSRGVLSRAFRSALKQSGGPPDSYDFKVKIQFEVWTTKGVL
jgi:hypothetical protein